MNKTFICIQSLIRHLRQFILKQESISHRRSADRRIMWYKEETL
jgi:hypothetical protein